MTPGDRPVGDHVTWDGSSQAVAEIRDLLLNHTSEGTLRIVLQQITLREKGREVGIHEVIDAVTDVGGNLVSIPLAESVRADYEDSVHLDAAISHLRADIVAEMGAGVDSLEVILDGDGQEQVRIADTLEVSAQDVAAQSAHPLVHGGAHHITHNAPTLDDLRERLAGPPPGLLRRAGEALRRWVRP